MPVVFGFCVSRRRFLESCRGTTTRPRSAAGISSAGFRVCGVRRRLFRYATAPSATRFFPELFSECNFHSQGGTSSAVSVSVSPSNGFTGSVQVMLSGLPVGVTSNQASPFDVAAEANLPVVFGAASNAAPGNFTVSAQGSSGALSHSQTLALTVQTGVASTLARTNYIRTDAVLAADAPFGESHHHHLAYDPANKQVFVANRAMNRVEVFSTSSQTRIAQISVPGGTSADLSADGATIWIGTARNEIVAVDPVSLSIKNRYAPAGLTPIPNVIFDRPIEVLSLSNSKAMVRLRQPVSAEALLALWDPVSNSLTDLTAAAPVVFQNGVGALARSGDHSKVLAAANDSSGEVALFDSGGNVVGSRYIGDWGNNVGRCKQRRKPIRRRFFERQQCASAVSECIAPASFCLPGCER